jgi:hypothetical protein
MTLRGRPLRGYGAQLLRKAPVATGGGGDPTPGGATDVILKAGSTSGGILLAGGAGYIKKAG